MTEVRRLQLGSCPDSWGVWFANDPLQTPWSRFLDELAGVGYEWLELGPYGYLPTDPSQLQDELARRELKVAAGTMHGLSGLHRADEFAAIVAQTRKVAELTRAWTRNIWFSYRFRGIGTTPPVPIWNRPSSPRTSGAP